MVRRGSTVRVRQRASNPARSIGPAVVTGDLHALWLYIAAPLVGAAVGALAYQFVRGD